MKTTILLAHLQLPVPVHADQGAAISHVVLGTVLANLAYFGFAPNFKALERLAKLSDAEVEVFWADVEPALISLTGDDREMDRFVVYKNFPHEVLGKSQADYWLAQILMYIGAPNEWFTEVEDVRAPLSEKLKLKVLAPAQESSLSDIHGQLVANKARWTKDQLAYALWLARLAVHADVDLAVFGFKENGLNLIAQTLGQEGSVTLNDATDVLRLAAAMSGQDVALRETVSFRSFKRDERRFLLSLLDDTKNLRADMAARPQLFKRMLARLHPGDFKFMQVKQAYDALFKGELQGFNSLVEGKLAMSDDSVIVDLAARPGEYVRRLHKLYASFGMKAVHAFAPLAAKLTTLQLLKLQGYVRGINEREKLIFPPKGNWTKAKVVDNEKKLFSHQALAGLQASLNGELARRMAQAFPDGVNADPKLSDVKLQTNDQELAPYGRGTSFPIPEDVTFIRTASYWACKSAGSVWFDNGVNFFDENWQSMGACCWNANQFEGAAFSGDPTNSKDMAGRACQMIDLYPKKLAARGVRYAVWNVLCFSHIAFDEANDVLATLQWGADAQTGKLYEPARAQMVFPLRGKAMTKYVAYLDLAENRLVYMDANFKGKVESAVNNSADLTQKMPAFLEYLASLPSVGDLMANAREGKVPILYSDADTALTTGEPAYVFKPARAENDFKQVDLLALL